ncbi:hypothetical protein HZY86_07720 [Aerococcaceae bacterium DSM 111020]|nr:hypothetical protein [Aerococcaceae bacterium DSM 111020]
MINSGKQLVELHVNYEKVPASKNVEVIFNKSTPTYMVEKMKFGRGKNKSQIIFNKDITIKNIPEKAYGYIISGRSAIEWVMYQYRMNFNKTTGIVDGPNDYSEDPKYIFNLLLSIINVSVQTVDIVNSLPPLEIIDE